MMKHIAVVKFKNQQNHKHIYSKPYNFLTDIENLIENEEVVVETRYGESDAIFIKYDDNSYFNAEGREKPSKWVLKRKKRK